MAHRFFIPAGAIRGVDVTFDQNIVHQLRDVLRLRPGQDIVVLDGQGWEYDVKLDAVERAHATGKVTARRLAQGEPKTKIVLFQALLKGGNLDLVLQKCTEVGVIAFVPLLTARTIISPDAAERETKQGRWARIIQEAAEQSRRGRVPKLEAPMRLEAALRQASGLSLIPWEGESARSLKDVLTSWRTQHKGISSVNLFIGPEGGFANEEIEAAEAAGVVPVTLGPRILRAETAGLVAASAILYDLGDLGG